MTVTASLTSPAFLTPLLAMGSFALVGAITPGPVNVLALRHGSHGPRRRALLYVLGASLSYGAIVALMGLFATQMALLLPRLAGSAQWVCAAYLLWLAWKLAQAAPAAGPAAAPGQAGAAALPSRSPFTPSPWQPFIQGVTVQTLNPKAWLFALSAIGVFVPPQPAAGRGALLALCVISLAACLIGVGCWALLGRTLMGWLHTPGRQRALHRALAALLVISVLGMLA